MPNTDSHQLTVGQLAEQAAHAIRLLNHRTRPNTGGLADPLDTAEIIAALASTASMLPQLLGQLARWLEHQHHTGRLRVDAVAPLSDTAHTVHALTDTLHRAIQCVHHAAEELDTAHEHAAHLASAEPATSDQDPITDTRWGQNSCRSVGPTHLTKRSFPPSPAFPGSGCPQLHRIAATTRR